MVDFLSLHLLITATIVPLSFIWFNMLISCYLCFFSIHKHRCIFAILQCCYCRNAIIKAVNHLHKQSFFWIFIIKFNISTVCRSSAKTLFCGSREWNQERKLRIQMASKEFNRYRFVWRKHVFKYRLKYQDNGGIRRGLLRLTRGYSIIYGKDKAAMEWLKKIDEKIQ